MSYPCVDRGLSLLLLSGLGVVGRAQEPALLPKADLVASRQAPVPFQVVNGYLLAHVPLAAGTRLLLPVVLGEDQGMATWTQRGQLLRVGMMKDSQGRTYNVRILPGYVAPLKHGSQGWSEAASNLGDYGQASTWNHLGRDSRSSLRWGWEDAFWDFGLKGSGDAWSENFHNARSRSERKTFGWPLAYPWAALSSTFESLVRVPLGALGAALGTATGTVLVPAGHLVWPVAKAAYHTGVDGVLLPVSGWAWQTLAAPPASLFAAAPTPSRADGKWMKVQTPPSVRLSPTAATADPELSEPELAVLASYAQEAALLDAGEAQTLSQDRLALEALRTRQQEARVAARAAREVRLQAWAQAPEHQAALQELIKVGGDAASIRRNQPHLEACLLALGLSEPDAKEAVAVLARHPPLAHPPVSIVSGSDEKTDPVREALKTVDRVVGTTLIH